MSNKPPYVSLELSKEEATIASTQYEGSSADRFRVLHRDGFKCAYCGKQAQDTELEVDHIVPRSRGGVDHFDNLITACVACNRSKSDFEMLPEHVERLIAIAKKRNAELGARPGVRKAAVTIRGVEYESCASAARALSISPKAVMSARRRGQESLDKCGLNKAMQKAGAKGASKQRKVFVVDGVSYNGAQEYADAKGVPIDTAYGHCHRGTAEHKEQAGVCATVDGIYFKTLRQIMEHFGVGRGAASRMAKSGTSGTALKGKPVTYRGERFNSHLELAERLGLSPATVSEAVRRNRVDGLGRGARARKAVIWGDVEYASAASLAEELGVSQGAIWRSIEYGSRGGKPIRYKNTN